MKVLCSACNSELKTVYQDNSLTVYVNPCKLCLREAENNAIREERIRHERQVNRSSAPRPQEG